MKTPKFKKIISKYRLIFYNDSTYTEVYSVKLSIMNIYVFVSISLFLLLFFGFLTISTFTPLKNFIIDYQQNVHKRLSENVMKIELLENQLEKQNLYINNLNKIINGEVVNFTVSNDQTTNLKPYYEHGANYSSSLDNVQYKLASLTFYPPVKGIIIDTMYIHTSHFGIDIATHKNASVFAVLNGTIIFADWTTHSGYVIYIQHDYNIISVYKHNAEFLKSVGSKIYAGDVIAFVGNTGEYSTGPHLHFELWYNGTPLNPKDYIVFY